MIRDAVQSLVNVFVHPTEFFNAYNASWQNALSYNASFAAAIASLTSVFSLVYFDVLGELGWEGALLTFGDIVIQPVFVVISVLLWSTIVFATLQAWEKGAFQTVLSVIGFAWLASYPYSLAGSVIYVVRSIVPASSSVGSLILQVLSFAVSVSSIIHVTTASVLGLRETTEASWVQGLVAALIVPLAVVLVVFGGIIALSYT